MVKASSQRPCTTRGATTPSSTGLRLGGVQRTAEMDRIQIGMHVDIKRSDGRVHGAVVSEIKKNKAAVLVEWYEKGETKGKEVDLDELFSINPMLVGNKSTLSENISQSIVHHQSQPTPTTTTAPSVPNRAHQYANATLLYDVDDDLDNDENETLLIPPVRKPVPPPAAPAQQQQPERMQGVQTRMQPPTSTTVPQRRSMLYSNGSNKDIPSALDELPQVVQPRVVRGSLPAPTAKAAATRPAAAARKTAISPSEPVAASQPMVRSMEGVIEEGDYGLSSSNQFDKKGATVQEIERLQKQRDERRAQQDRMKKAKEAEKAVDPGNPNYQFLMMIREYQGQIDYRPLKMSDPVTDTRISVCVRKRPMSRKELTKKEIEVITIPNRDHLIVHQPQVKVDLTKYLENLKFRFDYSFDENVTNEMVYRFTAQPLVRTIFEQGVATCFAYGQTGSGKTHTMGGDFSGKAQDCSKGVYALAASDVFRLQRGEYRSMGLHVGCSFFEIYGGKVFDLLKNKNLLRVLEDGNKEVQVVGLQEEVVTSEQQVLDLIKKGTDVRTAGTTSANSNSSRSHAVFQIILRKNKKQWGKFSLIDLAGNERGQDTGNADRQTRMEGAEINKSLLALKECIRAMGKNSNHVPFRQSKLTMVLRDSFVGENARTCMIAMISPSMSSCEHTVNTLRYADRVKELGCDEGGNASPMRDDELMIVDAEGDVEAVLQANVNGSSKNDVKLEKVIAAMAHCEEKVINDQYGILEDSKKETRDLFNLLGRINDVDYDFEGYAKEWIRQLEQQMADRRSALENANRWLKVIQQESELSAKAKKK